jgi:hypothetical protein
VLFVSLGALIVVLRPSRLTWAFFFFCLGVHPHMSANWQDASPASDFAGAFAVALLYSIGYAALFVFAARYPDDHVTGRFRFVQWAAVPVFVLMFGGFTWTMLPYFAPVTSDPIGLLIQRLVVAAAFSVALGAPLVKLRRANSAQRPGCSG